MTRPFRFSWKSSAPWLAALAFFAALLVTGLLVYPDYGLAWDEPSQVDIGVKTWRYVVRHDPALLSLTDRYYGPFFEVLLVVLQSKGPSQVMYLSRHLLNFLCFFAGCLGFFGLARYLTKSTWLALLGSLFLVLSPRIFADAFYNSKDIPFLVFYLLALFSLLVFLDRPGWLTAVLHGLITAAMLAIRLPGLVLPAMTLGGLGIECLARRMGWKRAAGLGIVYLGVGLAALVLFWPALWPNPPAELLQAFRVMRSFPHPVGMLYFGQPITSETLPWHYIPAWLAVTTPLFYLPFILLGLGITGLNWLRDPRCLLAPAGRSTLILAGSVFLPLLTVIAVRSTLYDGWRQMFFIYPPLLLAALYGVEGVRRFLAERLPRWTAVSILCGLVLLGLAPTAAWMVANHPYQNVYFNRLAGPDLQTIRGRFPVDYWGLSYRAGLAYILQTDPDERIAIFAETEPGQRSAALFPTSEEKRLNFVRDLSQANYYIGNYDHEKSYPFKNSVYAVQVDGTPILSVFLLSEEEKR